MVQQHGYIIPSHKDGLNVPRYHMHLSFLRKNGVLVPTLHKLRDGLMAALTSHANTCGAAAKLQIQAAQQEAGKGRIGRNVH